MSDIRRPALRYFGGKWKLAPWIISHFPAHRVYIEPFGGAASVLLRKARSHAEVYNDLDGEIVNVFRVLQDTQANGRLLDILNLTPFSRDEFELAHEQTDDPVERARRTIIRSFFAHGSGGATRKHKCGFRSKNHNAGKDSSKDWQNYPKELRKFCDRLMGVTLENSDAVYVMKNNDGPETLHYVDPPYVFSSRSAERHGYRHELQDIDHEQLCAVLKELKGMVILSGYENDIYQSLGWQKVRREAFADRGAIRTEVLWMNPLAWDGQAQISMRLA